MHAINQYEEAILKSIENCAVNSFSLTAREANKASRNLKFLAEVFPLLYWRWISEKFPESYDVWDYPLISAEADASKKAHKFDNEEENAAGC